MTFSFDANLAQWLHDEKIGGVDEAVFIGALRFWIAKNEANGKHEHDGRYWTYNSIRAMCRLFPFWSRRQIERIVKNCRDAGLVLTARYSKDPSDTTLFYTVAEENLPVSPFGDTPSRNGDATLSRNGDNPSPNGETLDEQLYTQLEEEAKNPKTPLAQTVTNVYNATCTNLPSCRKLTAGRRASVTALLRKGYTLDDLRDAFCKANRSGFCQGKNERGWKADFDWLTNENNLVKVLEGKYDDARTPPPDKHKGGEFEQW